MKERPLYVDTWRRLSSEKAMVFLSGPRQAGKSTLANAIADTFSNRLIFNWDLHENQSLLLKDPAFFQNINRKDESTPLIVFDEIHKYRQWKNYIKGIYDTFSSRFKFLVLGSGRLDVYQKGGDSLAGRYFQFRLWPFTLAELAGERRPFDSFLHDPLQLIPDRPVLGTLWDQLSRVTGFPEPFLAGTTTFYEKWARAYRSQLIREDIRDATNIRHLSDVDLCYTLLPDRVGRLFSMENIAGTLRVSPMSVARWVETFESFHLIFRIAPWHQRISRAIVKEKKVYLFNPVLIEDPGAKFENMVALELWRAVSTWNDLGWGQFDLHFVRTKDQDEVDFLISSKNKPLLLIETKLSDDNVSRSLLKFQSCLGVPAVQLVNRRGVYKVLATGPNRTCVADALRWLAGLP